MKEFLKKIEGNKLVLTVQSDLYEKEAIDILKFKE